MKDAIKKIRERMKWGQIPMAKALGTTQSHLSKLERGSFEPSLPLLRRIIGFARKHRIKVTLEDFFPAENDK